MHYWNGNKNLTTVQERDITIQYLRHWKLRYKNKKNQNLHNFLLNGNIFGKKQFTWNVYFDFLHMLIRNVLFREEFSEMLS
jgi:hypothetical protein